MRLFFILSSWLFIKTATYVISKRDDMMQFIPDEIITEKIISCLRPSDYFRLKHVNRYLRTIIETLEDDRIKNAVHFSLFDKFIAEPEGLNELRSLLYERRNWRKPLNGNQLILDLLRSERECKILTKMLLSELYVAHIKNRKYSFPDDDLLSVAIDLTAYTCQKFLKKDRRIVSQCASLIGSNDCVRSLVEFYTRRYMSLQGRSLRAALGIRDRELYYKIKQLKHSMIVSRKEAYRKCDRRIKYSFYVLTVAFISIATLDIHSLTLIAVYFAIQVLFLLMVGDLIYTIFLNNRY